MPVWLSLPAGGVPREIKNQNVDRGTINQGAKVSHRAVNGRKTGIVNVCQNPICRTSLPPDSRESRRFCSDKCRLDGWALNRAAKILAKVLPAEWTTLKAAEAGK